MIAVVLLSTWTGVAQPSALPSEPAPAVDAAPAEDADPIPANETTTDVPDSPAPEPEPLPPPKPKGPKPAPTEQAIARDSTVPPSKPARKQWGRARPGSKQRFAAEFKIGPYLPEVDSRYSGPGFGPYATIFGRTNSMGETVKKPRLGVMPILAFEWQIVYLAGPLGIGTQIGFFRDRADALLAEPEAGENLRSSADKVTFGMVPLALLAVYRFELLADFHKVPLVPYMKAGIAYSFWWVKDGSKKIAVNEQGEKGRGGVVGWQINPGLAIRLDFIERGAAKKLDQATGINHAYVFGEFQLSRMRNFGIGNAIDLGDKTFFAGLAIEF